MKRLFILITLAGALTGARADLVMQQQVVTPSYNGTATLEVKGTKVRLDLYAGQPQALSTIADLNSTETITLLHHQKMYLKTPAAPKAKSPASQAPVPRPTGKTEKLGTYDTDIYTWSNSRGITGTAWVARNYPDFARIRTDLAVLDRANNSGNDMSPDLSRLPGMVVKSQVTGGGKTIIAVLLSARETPVAASQFSVPSGYTEMPRGKPLKAITRIVTNAPARK